MRRVVVGLCVLGLAALPRGGAAQSLGTTTAGALRSAASGTTEAGMAIAAPAAAAAAPADGAPVYLVYFWRARPGRAAEYARYIREVAEPIDAEAQRLGAFEEVHTYTPFMVTGAPGTDWTQMRVFRLKNFAALDSFSIKIDSATARIYPDPERRRAATSGRSADLRDLVREEIWRDFH